MEIPHGLQADVIRGWVGPGGSGKNAEASGKSTVDNCLSGVAQYMLVLRRVPESRIWPWWHLTPLGGHRKDANSYGL